MFNVYIVHLIVFIKNEFFYNTQVIISVYTPTGGVLYSVFHPQATLTIKSGWFVG